MKSHNTLHEIKSAKIPLKEAVQDILNIFTHSELGHFTPLTFAGSIPKSAFFDPSIKDEEEGVMMWYCHNDNIREGYPLLFLAAEQYSIQNIGANEPASQNLVVPKEIYSFKGRKTEADVLAYIKNQHVISSGPVLNGQLTKGIVTSLTAKFDAMQRSEGRPPFNETHWGYFQNNDGILTELVNQPNIEHIHYYFGYTHDPLAKNKIRIILMGADANHITKTSVIVQRSIPPLVQTQGDKMSGLLKK